MARSESSGFLPLHQVPIERGVPRLCSVPVVWGFAFYPGLWLLGMKELVSMALGHEKASINVQRWC